MEDIAGKEKKRILDFVTAESVYPLGYTPNGNLALKEQDSGEELYVEDTSFAREQPEKAFLRVEEEFYPGKALARKVARRQLKREMYKQERIILFWQAVWKLAQPGYINLEDENNETVKRILNSHGKRALELIQGLQEYIQDKKEKREILDYKDIRRDCFGELEKELAPCIQPQRILQELENLRLIGIREAQTKTIEEKDTSNLTKEIIKANYSGH